MTTTLQLTYLNLAFVVAVLNKEVISRHGLLSPCIL